MKKHLQEYHISVAVLLSPVPSCRPSPDGGLVGVPCTLVSLGKIVSFGGVAGDLWPHVTHLMVGPRPQHGLTLPATLATRRICFSRSSRKKMRTSTIFRPRVGVMSQSLKNAGEAEIRSR